VLAGGLIVAFASCSRHDAVKTIAQNEYVDPATCAQCHAEIARNYSNTGMAKAFHAPDAASVPDPKPYFHTASATWYQIFAKDGGWYQQWWQIGVKGQR
jgi:hypothetical protein